MCDTHCMTRQYITHQEVNQRDNVAVELDVIVLLLAYCILHMHLPVCIMYVDLRGNT